MFAAQARNVLMKRSTTLVTARRTAISGPPTVRISFAEKFAHGVVLSLGVNAVPVWVLFEMKRIRESAIEE